jgi:hypothetical protein
MTSTIKRKISDLLDQDLPDLVPPNKKQKIDNEEETIIALWNKISDRVKGLDFEPATNEQIDSWEAAIKRKINKHFKQFDEKKFKFPNELRTLWKICGNGSRHIARDFDRTRYNSLNEFSNFIGNGSGHLQAYTSDINLMGGNHNFEDGDGIHVVRHPYWAKFAEEGEFCEMFINCDATDDNYGAIHRFNYELQETIFVCDSLATYLAHLGNYLNDVLMFENFSREVLARRFIAMKKGEVKRIAEVDTCQSSSWNRVKLGDRQLEDALKVAKGTSYIKISTCVQKMSPHVPIAHVEDYKLVLVNLSPDLDLDLELYPEQNSSSLKTNITSPASEQKKKRELFTPIPESRKEPPNLTDAQWNQHRKRVRAKLTDVLRRIKKSELTDVTDKSDSHIRKLAKEIEEALVNKVPREKYLPEFRALVSSLPKNFTLCSQLLNGKLSVEELVKMDNDQLASEALRELRVKHQNQLPISVKDETTVVTGDEQTMGKATMEHHNKVLHSENDRMTEERRFSSLTGVNRDENLMDPSTIAAGGMSEDLPRDKEEVVDSPTSIEEKHPKERIQPQTEKMFFIRNHYSGLGVHCDWAELKDAFAWVENDAPFDVYIKYEKLKEMTGEKLGKINAKHIWVNNTRTTGIMEQS